MKKAFTLIEVNLAILIMATGILVMCGLYSLGFRENRQSVEDVAAAAFADTYLGPLIQGLQATNLTWTAWCRIGDKPTKSLTSGRGVAQAVWPKGGWSDYIQRDGTSSGYRVVGSPRSIADSYAGQLLAQIPTPYKGSVASVSSDFEYALVITRHGTVIQLAFRSARRKESLMSQPLFVAEVRFQGDPEQ